MVEQILGMVVNSILNRFVGFWTICQHRCELKMYIITRKSFIGWAFFITYSLMNAYFKKNLQFQWVAIISMISPAFFVKQEDHGNPNEVMKLEMIRFYTLGYRSIKLDIKLVLGWMFSETKIFLKLPNSLNWLYFLRELTVSYTHLTLPTKA